MSKISELEQELDEFIEVSKNGPFQNYDSNNERFLEKYLVFSYEDLTMRGQRREKFMDKVLEALMLIAQSEPQREKAAQAVIHLGLRKKLQKLFHCFKKPDGWIKDKMLLNMVQLRACVLLDKVEELDIQEDQMALGPVW